jgi:hypothetical protein
MPIVRFGLYFIPDEGSFYSAGSNIIGYDIRAEKSIQRADFIKPEWVAISESYGLHATITDAIYIDDTKLSDVEAAVTDIISCLQPSNRYVFSISRVGFWHEQSDQAAVHLKSNRAIELLHHILVTKIHPLGIGSEYTDRYKDNPSEYFSDSPSRIKKTELFYAPYIFDEFTPHFTCINPFKGTVAQRSSLEENLTKHFRDTQEIEMSKIALVVKSPADSHFYIRKEFNLH